MIKRQDLIDYLIFSLAIKDTNDPILSNISDEQLEIILIQKSRQMGIPYPVLPVDQEGLLLCNVKKEIYWKMATNSAPLYPLNLEGLQVKKDVRFDHYMKLISGVESEYKSILADPTRISIIQGEILIDKPYTRSRYQRNYQLPTPYLHTDKTTSSALYFNIDYNDLQLSDFYRSNIYICEEPVWDKYEECKNPKARLFMTIESTRKRHFKIGDLQPNTKYYVLLEVCIRREEKVYVEVDVSTNE